MNTTSTINGRGNSRGRIRGRGRRGRGRNTNNGRKRRPRKSVRSNRSIENMKHERVSLHNLISQRMHSFSEAVVNPFGQGAYGAVAPDKTQPVVLPLFDRLSIDFQPLDYKSPAIENGLEQVYGFVVFFMPRCLSAGWLQIGSESNERLINTASVSSDFKPNTNNDYNEAKAYSLCLGVHGANNQAGNFESIYCINSDGELELGVNVITYANWTDINATMENLRILGAGIKCWPEAAPINTGGTVYSGQMQTKETYELLFFNQNNDISESTITDKLRHRETYPGVTGATGRYSVLQDAKQSGMESTNINFFIDNTLSIPTFDGGISPGSFDLAETADYVPVIYWHYDTTEDLYSVRIQSIVHSMGIPEGNSPFATSDIHVDPSYKKVTEYLQNYDNFPLSAGGHSFKSFMNKAEKIVGVLPKYLETAAKIGKLVEPYL